MLSLLLLLHWHYDATILGDRIVGCLVDVQVCHDRFRRSMSKPFRERKVLKTIDLAEHLQEHQIGVACVLDVVELGLLDVPNVSLLKVHGASLVACGDHGHSAFAADKVLPLVRIWMPMQFS